MSLNILTKNGWEPYPFSPDDISLCLPSGEKMILKSSEWGTALSTLKGIGAFLCPNGVTQQNLNTLYGKHRQDIHISQQKR